MTRKEALLFAHSVKRKKLQILRPCYQARRLTRLHMTRFLEDLVTGSEGPISSSTFPFPRLASAPSSHWDGPLIPLLRVPAPYLLVFISFQLDNVMHTCTQTHRGQTERRQTRTPDTCSLQRSAKHSLDRLHTYINASNEIHRISHHA